MSEQGMSELDLVAEMHEAFEQPIRFVPDPTVPERIMRMNLLQEELNELGAAVGAIPDMALNSETEQYEVRWKPNVENPQFDAVEMVDALVDLEVVLKGAVLTFGATVIFEPVFDVVHASNMAKVVDGKLIRREDGKILKPEGWVAPTQEIRRIVEQAIDNG